MTDALKVLARIEADLDALRAMLAPRPREMFQAEEYLEPCILADRLGLSEGYVRKLIRRGLGQGTAGVIKRGGRLFATPDAVNALRAF